VAAMGSAQDCRKKVEEFERAGASYVVLYPVPLEGSYDRGVRAYWRLSPDRRSRISPPAFGEPVRAG
jgi:hypothetical protein